MRFSPGANFLMFTAVVCLVTGPVAAVDLSRSAADYIRKQARAGASRSIALFPFTNEEDEVTAATRKMTTKVIAALNAAGLTVIDQSKIADVLREQVRRQSGLYDDDSLPGVGRLAGASTLVYGTLDARSLQIRMVDAATGTVLGATVKEVTAEKKPGFDQASFDSSGFGDRVRIDPEDIAETKANLENTQLGDWLIELEKQDPELLVYVTSSREEFNAFADANPEQAGRVLDRIEALSLEELAKLNRMKKQVGRIRAGSPRITKRWRRLQNSARLRARQNSARTEKNRSRGGKRNSAIQRLRRTGPEAGRARRQNGVADSKEAPGKRAAGRRRTQQSSAGAGRSARP